MNANTILEQAEKRVESANANAHTATEQGSEGLRQEIGPQHYLQAQEQLPVVEKAIQEIYLPFFSRILAIAGRVTTPLPARVHQWLKELGEGCHSAPQQIRNGIEAYKTIRVLLWMDGKTPDPVQCPNLVYRVRRDLMSWDGRLTRFKDLMGWIAAWIKETNWPAAKPDSSPLAIEPPRPVSGIKVERDFQL